MIKIVKNSSIPGKHNKPIITDVFYLENSKPKPIVIFCHGYKGFKDWGAWDLVAKAFAKAGFFFIKFNFSHNGGTIENPIDFSDLEAFGNNNYIKELDDLETVIHWITSADSIYKNHINTLDITLIGHSRAGGIATIKASEDSRITRLITWASVSDYKNRFPKGDAFTTWEKLGVYHILNGRTKQQMPHYFQFYTSYIENEKRLTIREAVKRIKIPHLIIHGDSDPTVDLSEAKHIHKWNSNSELYLAKDANHVFGSKHPWDQHYIPKDLQTITEKSIEFARL